MPRFAWYAIALLAAVGAGMLWQREHQQRLVAEAAMRAWRDSTRQAVVAAQASEALYQSTKAAYYAQKPAVVQITKWKARVDTVLGRITVGKGDSTDVSIVQAVFDSLSLDAQVRDSLARAALAQADSALRAKDLALHLALHPPTTPSQRLGLYGVAAYDAVAHGVFVGGGAELRLGHVKPFIGVGATITQQTTGTIQAGIRYEF